MLLIPEAEMGRFCEIKTSLVYISSSRLARVT